MRNNISLRCAVCTTQLSLTGFNHSRLLSRIFVRSLVFLFEKTTIRHVNRLEVQLTALELTTTKLSQTNDGRLPVRFRTSLLIAAGYIRSPLSEGRHSYNRTILCIPVSLSAIRTLAPFQIFVSATRNNSQFRSVYQLQHLGLCIWLLGPLSPR